MPEQHSTPSTSPVGRPLRVLAPTGADERIHAQLSAAHRARLSRRSFLGGLGAVGAFALTSCADPNSAAPGSGGGGGLNIYSWASYDDPATLTDFTAAEGPAVTIDNYGSNAELASKLAAAKGTSGYDICVPTHSYVDRLAKQGLIAELDLSRLPNFTNLDPSVVDTEFDPGNKYSVCKDWGSTGYVYDTTRISREMTSWKDFIEVAQNEASGSLQLLEDQGEVSYIYLFSQGLDPNTEDEADVAAYRSWVLDEMAPHVTAFSSSASDAISGSEFALIHCWNGDARLGILGNDDPDRYRFVWPSEGANLWQDNWAVVKGAPNEDAAYQFIDYVLDPVVSLKELSYIGYNTGVKDIQEKAVAAGVEKPELVFVDDSIMSRLVYSRETSVTAEIITIYDELKAKAGS